MKIVIICTFSFLILLISGCSNYKTPGVYRIDIQQGNDITQEMISQLKPDMSKSQVTYILGTPLIIDTFNPDRWDYLYSFRPGNGLREQRNITIYFKKDKLDYLTGDIRTATVDELIPVLRIDSNVIVPFTDKKISFFSEMKKTIGIEVEPDENISQHKRNLLNDRPVPIPKKSGSLINRIVDSISSLKIQNSAQELNSKESSLLKRFISLSKDEIIEEKVVSALNKRLETKQPLPSVTLAKDLGFFDQLKNAIGLGSSDTPLD